MSSKGSGAGLSPEQLAPIRLLFFQECAEHLAALEDGLVALEQGETDPEIINTVFRAAHSIKGGAGIFGLDQLVRFAHDLETALAALRSGQVTPSREALKVLLHAADVISDLVTGANNDAPPDQPRVDASAAELAALCATASPDPASAAEDDFDFPDFTPVPVELLDPMGPWRIRFRPHAELFASANDPLALFSELARLGAIVVDLDASAAPPLQDLNPAESHLSWTIALAAGCDEAAIREVFEFVEGDCDLEIALAIAPEPSEAIAASTVVAFPPPGAPASGGARPTGGSAAASTTIRVDLDRIDRLIDLVSELVIGEAALAEQVSNGGAGDAHSNTLVALDNLRGLTRELQESVMAIRAQPIKTLFQRMSRLVRETEALTGKPVTLVTEGEDTEVDRAVIERLTDPLTHMIRNAIDHGIESPQDRLAAGKPAQGLVRASASHRAGRIVIDITDDGAGIDRERVRAIAVSRGLMSASDVLSDEDIDNLIFEPGFSTTDQASDLSGRGVGMDVVRRSVQALGGRISLSSQRGVGSTFSLSLPLTLAVMDGMMVSVNGQILVVPLTALLESVSPRPADIRQLGAGVEVLAIGGAHVPLIDLGAALNYPGQAARRGPRVALLVEDEAGERIALGVDEILEQRQVVIKSLETNYRALRGIAAATILGDGRVALIVDVTAIIAAQKLRTSPLERQRDHA